MTSWRHFCRLASMTLLLCVFASVGAFSRDWRQTPEAAARNYALILDSRSIHEMVMVFWIVPEMIPQEPGSEAAKKLLRQYVMVGVVHADVADTGTMTFNDVPAVRMTAASGAKPGPIASGSLPPAAASIAVGLQAIFRQSLGKFGEGMKWFYFDGTSVDSCGDGQVTISAVGENYTYDAPIPGCPTL